MELERFTSSTHFAEALCTTTLSLLSFQLTQILRVSALRSFNSAVLALLLLIQVDIGGHPPFPTGSKQFSGNFGNLLFLAVFWVLNFRSGFEALNDIFWASLDQKISS
jgi:hypothetical protein